MKERSSSVDPSESQHDSRRLPGLCDLTVCATTTGRSKLKKGDGRRCRLRVSIHGSLSAQARATREWPPRRRGRQSRRSSGDRTAGGGCACVRDLAFFPFFWGLETPSRGLRRIELVESCASTAVVSASAFCSPVSWPWADPSVGSWMSAGLLC